jgi:hypothetical protein
VATSFSISLVSTDLKPVTDALISLGSKGLGEAALRAVNSVASRTYNNTLEAMIAGINLSDEYVRSKTQLSLATNPLDATATLLASADSARPSTLTTFGAVVVAKPTKNQKRSKGNASVGVPQGYRQVGFNASVARGKVDFFSHSQSGNTYFFMIRTLSGKLLTVARQKDARGKGSLDALFGPSVLQLLNFQITNNIDAITEDLQTTLLAEVDNQLGGV